MNAKRPDSRFACWAAWGIDMRFVFLALAALSWTVEAATAQAPQDLLQQYKCYVCHADTEAKAGPAYVDVAAKYAGNRQAVTIIAKFVRQGGHRGGPWHMPPHPEVSDADAKEMARYILSLGARAIEKKD
jgi:cytochrome c